MQEFSAGEFISMIGDAKFKLLTKLGFKSGTYDCFTKAENDD